MAQKSKREDIVMAAFALFAANGFHATGMELVIQKSGVSKKTLYTHFPTKNDLILAVIAHYQQCFTETLTKAIESKAQAQEKLYAVFEATRHWYDMHRFNGCLAVHALGEFANKNEAIVRACQQFKQTELQIMRTILRDIGVQDAEKAARQLMLLLEGVNSSAHFDDDMQPKMEHIQDLIRLIAPVP